MKYYALFQDAMGHTNCILIPDADAYTATQKAIRQIFLTGEETSDVVGSLVKAYGEDFTCEAHLSSLTILEVSSETQVSLAKLSNQFKNKLADKKKVPIAS